MRISEQILNIKSKGKRDRQNNDTGIIVLLSPEICDDTNL